MLSLLAGGAPASARQGEMTSYVKELVRQLENRGVPASRKEKSCWLEAYGIVVQLGLKPLISEEGLGRLDPESTLAPIQGNLQGELSELTPGRAVDLFVRSDGDVNDFRLRLMKQQWTRKPDWKRVKSEKTAAELHEQLVRLSRQNVHTDFSQRYRKAGWTVDVSASYYPFSRRVTVFVLGSTDGGPNHYASTAVLNLVGVVEEDQRKPGGTTPTIKLEEVTFDATCAETNLAGRWTERVESKAGKVVLSNVLNLRISGSQVTGRWIQSGSSQANSNEGRVTYQLRGSYKAGVLEGDFTAQAERSALSWLKAPSGTVTGAFKGQLQGKLASGTVTLPSGQMFRWEARLE